MEHKIYDVNFAYQAGYAVHTNWKSGYTSHYGIGWFSPFGLSDYCYVAQSEEEKDFPWEKFMNQTWLDKFNTRGFCIHRTEHGDLYAFDGVFMKRAGPETEKEGQNDDCRRDMLVNVFVGGTGMFQGAFGILWGTTEGSGEIGEAVGASKGPMPPEMAGKLPPELLAKWDKGESIPSSLLKIFRGFIKIPVRDEQEVL